MKKVIKTTLKGMPYVGGLAGIVTLFRFYPDVMVPLFCTSLVLFTCYIAGTISDIPKGKRVR
jgi:hypothetical protein